MQSGLQEAGKYNVSEKVVPGYANNSWLMRRSSFDPREYFEFTALPTITAVSPPTGNIGGQHLTIAGTGFSGNLTNNSVTVDGNPCLVTSSSNNQIKCTLQPQNLTLSTQLLTNSFAQQNGFFSGAGLRYARYARTNAITTLDALVAAVRTGNTTALGTPL
jgi:hypothetical protein